MKAMLVVSLYLGLAVLLPGPLLDPPRLTIRLLLVLVGLCNAFPDVLQAILGLKGAPAPATPDVLPEERAPTEPEFRPGWIRVEGGWVRIEGSCLRIEGPRYAGERCLDLLMWRGSRLVFGRRYAIDEGGCGDLGILDLPRIRQLLEQPTVRVELRACKEMSRADGMIATESGMCGQGRV